MLLTLQLIIYLSFLLYELCILYYYINVWFNVKIRFGSIFGIYIYIFFFIMRQLLITIVILHLDHIHVYDLRFYITVIQ